METNFSKIESVINSCTEPCHIMACRQWIRSIKMDELKRSELSLKLNIRLSMMVEDITTSLRRTFKSLSNTLLNELINEE